MPRWILVALVVVGLLWLGGLGMRAFAGDEGPASPEDASAAAESWFGGVASLFPDPALLTAADVRFSGSCGAFPDLEIEGGERCRVLVSENGGRRAARFRLESGRAELSVEAARGAPVRRELESGEEGQVELRFDDDGGALELHCRSASGRCHVRLVR
jgi:hypothetical protein